MAETQGQESSQTTATGEEDGVETKAQDQGKGRAEARAQKKREEEELKLLLAEENILDEDELVGPLVEKELEVMMSHDLSLFASQPSQSWTP